MNITTKVVRNLLEAVVLKGVVKNIKVVSSYEDMECMLAVAMTLT